MNPYIACDELFIWSPYIAYDELSLGTPILLDELFLGALTINCLNELSLGAFMLRVMRYPFEHLYCVLLVIPCSPYSACDELSLGALMLHMMRYSMEPYIACNELFLGALILHVMCNKP